MLVCSRDPSHRHLGVRYCQEPGCGAKVLIVWDDPAAKAAGREAPAPHSAEIEGTGGSFTRLYPRAVPANGHAAIGDATPSGAPDTSHADPNDVDLPERDFPRFLPLSGRDEAARYNADRPATSPLPQAAPPSKAAPDRRPPSARGRPAGEPRAAKRAWRMWLGVLVAVIAAALILTALVTRERFDPAVKTPALPPRPDRARVAPVAGVAAADNDPAPPTAAKVADGAAPPTGSMVPETMVPPAAAPNIVTATPFVPARWSAARLALDRLEARALRRERAAAAALAAGRSSLRRSGADELDTQAESAMAAIRATTAQVKAAAAAFDTAAAGDLPILLSGAAQADRSATAQSRLLRATLAQAKARPARPPSPAPTIVETARSAPPAPPPVAAPLSFASPKARRNYDDAVRSYSAADRCYRDLVADLPKAYVVHARDGAHNRDTGQRVRDLYDRLAGLAKDRDAVAGVARGSSALRRLDKQVDAYVDQCIILQNVLNDRVR